MFYIDPVSCRKNEYTLVKKVDNIKPIAAISSKKDGNRNNNNSNSSTFQEALEEQKKVKKKTKIDQKI